MSETTVEEVVVLAETPDPIVDGNLRLMIEGLRADLATVAASREQFATEIVQVRLELDRANESRVRHAEQVVQLQQALESSRQAHRKDIQIIGDELMQQAERRDWCSEYDDAVSLLNQHLSVDLPVREEERELEVRVNIEGSITVTLTVTARRGQDDDELEDLAREAVENMDSSDYENYRLRDVSINSVEFDEIV